MCYPGPCNPARAFTLIEILIVVVILGILSALVVPQFASASQDAQEAALHSQLQTVRSQIAQYDFQDPDGDAPFDGTSWTPLVENEYLHREPFNMINDSTDISVAASLGNGWCFQPNATGDAWSVTVRPLDSAGVLMFTDLGGLPY